MRVIYALKICIFRSQLLHRIEKRKINALMQFCAFIIRVYVKHWFQCQSSVLAPLNDLMLLKELKDYEICNQSIATSAQTTFLRHLWYLSEHISPLAFFDDRILVEQLRLMVQRLKDENNSAVEKEIHEKEIADCINSKSMLFFESLKLDTSFLSIDPSLWNSDDAYRRAKATTKKMLVVNDIAERGVALANDYRHMTKSEEDFQCLLQCIEKNRKDNSLK